MRDYPTHPRMYPMGHAQPLRPYDRHWQPSVYMTAYLGTHTCLTHGQTVSIPIASAGLNPSTARYLHDMITQPCGLTHMTPQGSHHLSQLLLSEPRCSLPFQSVWHPSEKTCGTW